MKLLTKVKNKNFLIFLSTLLIWAVALAILVRQPYGIIAIGICMTTIILLIIIKKKWVSGILFVICIIGSGVFLIKGTMFHLENEKKRDIFKNMKTTVNFEDSFEEALTKSKLAGKPIFLEFYTAWCTPCLAFAKFVLTDKEVGDLMNRAFINFKVDAEKGMGVELRKRYKPSGYPTLLVIDSDGNLLEDLNGNLSPTKDLMLQKSKEYLTK